MNAREPARAGKDIAVWGGGRAWLALMVSAMLLFLAGCSGEAESTMPRAPELDRVARRGKLGNSDGVVLFGSDRSQVEAASAGLGIGVNSYLWRATLDTLAFMPLISADPFGGVILTDWHEAPNHPKVRFKLNVRIVSERLQTNALSVSAFEQRYDPERDIWRDVETPPSLARKIEDAILTRARELRVQAG